MASYRTTRFIQVSFVLLIVVLVIVGLAYAGRLLFAPSGGSTDKADTSESSLVSTNADRAIRMTVRGPIVADEEFRSYQIQITPNERALTLYKGYLNEQFDNITLGNNIPSYKQLVNALNRAGMVTGSEFTGENNDTSGICATGKLYELQILKASKPVKTLWTTSCSSLKGSFTGSLSAINNLIQGQIPGASVKISRLW